MKNMASPSTESQDKYKLYKFTKILTLKVAQIVVQSRQGKKITHANNNKLSENGAPASPNLQWFNLSIPDEPGVNTDTTKVLNGEVVDALANVLCIEISLHTNDGDEMVLELWTVKMMPGCDFSLNSVSAIYYRMSIMLKSTLTISRITPAYKMSRSQQNETYSISHKIYGGQPNFNLLGEQSKVIKVSELGTPIGTILIEVVYRTKMTIVPEIRPKAVPVDKPLNTHDGIMVKSDHFPMESPKKNNEKKGIDLSKPLTAGAFVDVAKIKELHDALSLKLPPEPPMSWLISKEIQNEKLASSVKGVNISKPSSSGEGASCSAPNTASKAIDVPKSKIGDKYTSLMEFPFAGGSPIAELANFYQECLQARSTSDEWTEIANEPTASTDSESLSQQLKMYEEAVPEFDNMVASMFSNSEESEY